MKRFCVVFVCALMLFLLPTIGQAESAEIEGTFTAGGLTFVLPIGFEESTSDFEDSFYTEDGIRLRHFCYTLEEAAFTLLTPVSYTEETVEDYLWDASSISRFHFPNLLEKSFQRLANGVHLLHLRMNSTDGDASGHLEMALLLYKDQVIIIEIYSESFLAAEVCSQYMDEVLSMVNEEGVCTHTGAQIDVNTATFEMTESEGSITQFTELEVGNYVSFGRYPQTAQGRDDTPIEWLVLARDGDKALLISRYALDCRPYNLKLERVTWASCGLRTWLNNTFLNEAFNEWENMALCGTMVEPDPNPEYATHQGYETFDKVFLLSTAETEKYLTSDAARECIPTEYAIKQGAYIPASIGIWNTDPTDKNCVWWLRTSGFSSENGTYVYPEGRISYSGDTVFRDSYAVRPAIWVDMRTLTAPTPVPTAKPTPAPTPTPSPTPIVLPTAPNAQIVQSGDYSYVELSDGTVRITDYTGSVLHVEIPELLDGKRVTSIGSEAFWGAFGGTIIIPDGVTDLGWHAFSRIDALDAVTLPESLRYIDSLAFSDCKNLFSITIPEGVATLGNEVFENSGIMVIYLPSTLTEVDEGALHDAENLRVVHLAEGMTRIPENLCRQVQNVVCVVIPDTVTEIGAYFGYKCPKLKCVYVPASVTCIEGGALAYSEQLTVYVHEGSAAHQYCIDERINYQLVRPTTAADFEYQLQEDGTACITRYLGTSPDVTIPATLDGRPVTAIGDYAFYAAYILQHLNIPEGVTSIGTSAFGFCESLIEVHLPNTLISVGDYAFSACTALMSIELPDGLREIGKKAFDFSLSLQAISIPGSVERIGESAFNACYCLRNITLGNGVKSIGLNAFYGTPWETLSIGEGATRIGKLAFHARYPRPTVRCNLPASLQNIQSDIFSGTFNWDADTQCTVVKGSLAEWYCQEKRIPYTCIPGLDLTGSMADSTLPAPQHEVDSHLTLGSLQVDIPAGFAVAETAGKSFTYTANPNSRSSEARLTLSYASALRLGPASADLSSFGSEADTLSGLVWFDYQLDNGMWLSRAVASQYNYNGEQQSVAAAVISDGETAVLIVCSYLGGNEHVGLDFVDTVLSGTIRVSDVPPPTGTPVPTHTTIPAPTQVPTMELPAIASEKDFEYTILEDGTVCITKYLGRAEVVVVPQKIDGRQVSVIGTEAFCDWQNGSTVRELILPEGLRRLEFWALSTCENLEYVYIPQSVTEIGHGAFSLCGNLLEVDLPASLTTIESLLFDGCSRLTRVRIPDSVTLIENDAFFRCENLVEVNIPTSVTTIRTNPFTKCNKLRAINISTDHPAFNFEDGALFERATGRLISFLSDATSYTIPAHTTEIAIGAFCGSQNLAHVVLNDLITEIPGTAFEYTGLTEIAIPDNVTRIGYFAFAGCQQLVSVEIGRNVTEVSESAFARCSKLETIALPEGLETIGDYAFEECEALRILDIPDSVTKIGYDVFDRCDVLTVIVGADTYAETYCKETGVRYALRERGASKVATEPTVEPTATPTLAPMIAEATTAVPTAASTTETTSVPTAVPAASSTTEPMVTVKHLIPGESGAYQYPVQKASANSHVVANSGTYDATKAVDGDETTCWQFSTKKCALGEAAIEIVLPSGSTVDELWIKNGFWYVNRGLDQYTRNGRPKQIGVSFLYDGEKDYRDEVQLTLRDDKERKDWQKVILGRHEHVSAVRIRIISIYKGTKFKTDVAISEVMFIEREGGPASIVYETLKRGSKGDDVLAMKVRLQELGYFKQGAELSESYNDTCAERVKQFQKVNGLPQTGTADHETLTLLYSEEALPKK